MGIRRVEDFVDDMGRVVRVLEDIGGEEKKIFLGRTAIQKEGEPPLNVEFRITTSSIKGAFNIWEESLNIAIREMTEEKKESKIIQLS